MWQRFTERARRIILLAQEEAGKMNSNHVGTEHLLLGLVRENEGVAAQVLTKMGVSLAKVRNEIEGEVQPGSDPTSGEPKLTPKAKRVLELAADEGRRMRHNYIGTEHLLLALLREKDGLAATVLRRLGLNLESAREQVMEYLGPDGPSQSDDGLSQSDETADVFEDESASSSQTGWQRFSDRARRVVLLAQEEALQLEAPYVGSEHLLVGLLRENEGVAANALAQMGVGLDEVRQIIKENAGQEAPFMSFGTGEPKLSPHAKRILELASDEARKYRKRAIGTEHLLLAILRESEGQAATILRRLSVNLDEARAQILDYAGPRQDPLDTRNEQRRMKVSPLRDPQSEAREDRPALWNRLDDHAQIALGYAQQEATIRRHTVVGSEHVLLGLLSTGGSTAAGLLRARGIFLPSLRVAVKAFSPDGSADAASHARFDFNVARLLQRAAEEAKSLGRYAIGTEHLLLALLSDQSSFAAQIVDQLMSEASDLEARLNARLSPATELVDLPSQRLRCSPATVQVIEIAAAQARRLGQTEITPEVLFAALLRVSDESLEAILKQAKKDIEASDESSSC